MVSVLRHFKHANCGCITLKIVLTDQEEQYSTTKKHIWLIINLLKSNIWQETTMTRTYWFTRAWICAWARRWMDRTSTRWSIWIKRLRSIVLIIPIVHGRSTSWRWGFHVTTTSSCTANTYCQCSALVNWIQDITAIPSPTTAAVT